MIILEFFFFSAKPSTSLRVSRTEKPRSLCFFKRSLRGSNLYNLLIFKRLVAPVGFEPTTNGLCLPLRLSPRFDLYNRSLWSGLSLHFTCLPFSLYTFLILVIRLGSGLPYRFHNLGFPDFDRFYKQTWKQDWSSNVIRLQPIFEDRMNRNCFPLRSFKALSPLL